MMIKSVYLSKLFNEYDYELFFNGPLNYIHSPNGFGKSTLMHLMTASLRGDVRFLAETPFERLDISFDNSSTLIVENRAGNIIMQISMNGIVSPIEPSEVPDMASSCYIGPERIAVRRSDGHIAPALDVYAQELYERISYARGHRSLEKPVEVRRSKTEAELDKRFWDIKAKLDYIKDAGLEPDIPSGMRLPPSRYEIMNYRDEYEEFASELEDYIACNHLLAESVITLKDIVNHLFINKTLDVNSSGKLCVQMDNGTMLPLNRLSSGEKQVIIMFYNLLFHTTPGSIVIVDEPEISLHISWQQRIGVLFSDICRVRNIQIIIATHSPQIIHDMWDSAVELRSKDA
jgi:ABC-type lipoprotein export system ATPase subunit